MIDDGHRAAAPDRHYLDGLGMECMRREGVG